MRCLLVGNPNAGKTSLFNTLTGETAHTGNWSGVTVDANTAQRDHVTFVDLPGLYNLDETGRIDERVARDALKSSDVDVLVNVIDATQLERQLFLTSELAELKHPMVIMLTMMDKAQQNNITVDMQQLSEALGCPVVSDVDSLVRIINAPLHAPTPLVLEPRSNDVADAELALLDARYQAIHLLVGAVEKRATSKRTSFTTLIDKVVLHRVLAFPIFFAVMYLLFFVVVGVGGFFQTRIMDTSELLLSHLGYFKGLGFGLCTMLSFIPVMGLMFFLLAALETSGYMARVAFVMDRLMRFLGLPGKAFVPLMIGFGCNVPAVMAARTLDSKRDRMLTILMSPFMSCSARLTIYTVFVTAFFPSGGHNIVFSLYLVGVAMAVLTGFLLRKTLFNDAISPLLLELPEYQLPNVLLLCKHTMRKLSAFLLRAGRYIMPICMVLGLLGAISIGESNSILVIFGQKLQPLFAPMGISEDNWPAVVGLITGVFAKEVVIGTLNSLYADMGSLSQFFDGAAGAYAYLLFILLYVPCASTIAVIREEAGRRLMWFSVFWSTALAYGTSVLFYQLATFHSHPEMSLLWVVRFTVGFVVLVTLIRRGGLKGGLNALRSS